MSARTGYIIMGAAVVGLWVITIACLRAAEDNIDEHPVPAR